MRELAPWLTAHWIAVSGAGRGEKMKKTGMFVSTIGVQTGAAAIVLYLANLAIWSALTAMLGGAMALIGMGLVIWALYPIRRNAVQKAEERVLAQAEAA